MTDGTGNLPPLEAFYQPPLKGRLAVMGLQGATVANLIYGGMPGAPSMTEPPGDQLEQDIPVTFQNTPRDWQSRPGLPSASTLDYVHKAGSATLVLLVLGLLIVYAIIRPQRALKVLEGRGGA